MRAQNDNGNFIYDDNEPLCFTILHIGPDSQLFAFVQCIDVGFDTSFKSPRRYWGYWSHDDPAGSMKTIMETGGKWPDLPGPPPDLAD